MNRYDQGVRNLETCVSCLDQAYYLIKDMDLPDLKKQIHDAMTNAQTYLILEEDRINERN